MNILIADDSLLSRNYLKKILGLSGLGSATLLEASNGRDAFTIISEKEIEFLFLDINMPIVTGIELVEMLNEKKMIKKLEIIITSSLADQGRIDYLKSKGVNYFIRKPFTPEALTKIIELLNGKNGGKK